MFTRVYVLPYELIHLFALSLLMKQENYVKIIIRVQVIIKTYVEFNNIVSDMFHNVYQIFLSWFSMLLLDMVRNIMPYSLWVEVVGLERGPLNLMNTI
jgi:hypothetical protein